MKTQKVHSQARTKKSSGETYRINLTVLMLYEGMMPPVGGNSATNLRKITIKCHTKVVILFLIIQSFVMIALEVKRLRLKVIFAATGASAVWSELW